MIMKTLVSSPSISGQCNCINTDNNESNPKPIEVLVPNKTSSTHKFDYTIHIWKDIRLLHSYIKFE